ncbi:ABC transporter substrate-binding protein [Thermodesulfatator atlanticus]|uniref:ABC transporter substrate-binding protein n=1 Tax=Thermodesulfatator atlanticus TaxID=501497 RepID=UPI00042098A8|nr:ABC transporter substrate-binding protein [Thermodesulfatator atlanticus]
MIRKTAFLIFFVLFLAQSTWAALKVGVVLPLSGKDAQAGQELQLWITDLSRYFAKKGVYFELFFFDSQGNPYRIKKVVENAFFKRIDVLIGPFTGSCAGPLVKEAKSLNIPVIITAGEINPIKFLRNPLGPVFRTGISTRAAVKVLYHCLQKQGIHRIGLLLTKDPIGQEGEKWLTAYATEHAIKITKKRYFGVSDTDVSYHLEQMLDCEAVVCWAPPRSCANVARNVFRQGYKIPIYFPHFVADEPFLRENQNLYAFPFVGAAFLTPDKFPGDKNILNLWLTFHSAFGIPYRASFASYADALIFLTHAVKKGGYRHWLRELDKLGLVKGLTGLYFLSTDDHYGLIAPSAGVFSYDGFNYEAVCKPQRGIF